MRDVADPDSERLPLSITRRRLLQRILAVENVVHRNGTHCVRQAYVHGTTKCWQSGIRRGCFVVVECLMPRVVPTFKASTGRANHPWVTNSEPLAATVTGMANAHQGPRYH